MRKIFKIILTIIAYVFLTATVLQLALNIYFKFKSIDLIVSTLFMIIITALTFYVAKIISGNKKSKFNISISIGLAICSLMFLGNYLILLNHPSENKNLLLSSGIISLVLLISFIAFKKYKDTKYIKE